MPENVKEIEDSNMKSISANKNKIEISLSTVVPFLGILVSISYAFGYLYDQGYLSEYGISTEYVVRTHQDYIFRFAYVILSLFSGLITLGVEHVWYILLYIFAIAGFAFILLQSKGSKGIPKNIKKIITKIESNNTIVNAAKSSYLFIILVIAGIIGLYAIASLFLIMFLPFATGQEDAKKEKDKFTECVEGTVNKNTCIYLYKDKKKVLSGSLIAKSDQYIYLWDGKRPTAYPLKGETVYVEKAQRIKK